MLKNRSIIYPRLVGFLLTFLAISCSTTSTNSEQVVPKPSHNDESWLSDIPCKAPCWYGLEPGKTSKEEALLKAKDSPYLDSKTVTEEEISFFDPVESKNISGQGLWFRCSSSVDDWCAYLRFKENIHYDLLIPLDTGVTFKKTVEKLGIPDGYVVNRINAETKGCTIDLLWWERQMEVRYSEKTHLFGKDLCDRIFEEDNQVPPDLVVQEVYIMQKDLVSEITSRKNYTPWKGFIPDK